MIEGVVEPLVAEAAATNERRLLVLAGDRETGWAMAERAVDTGGFDPARTVRLGHPDADAGTGHPMDRSADLLGTTQDALVFDAHDRLDPNAVGRTVGTVDGGGLLLLLTPPLGAWASRRDAFDATLAVPPFGVEDVAGNFRSRFVETLRAHPGIAIVDVDDGEVERDGLTDPTPRRRAPDVEPPAEAAFPHAAYGACLTDDQVRALAALEALAEPDSAVVIEANRGRGKSSVAGLAAACLAAEGEDVVVTAPAFANARAAFDRAAALLAALEDADQDPEPRVLETAAGGCVRFAEPDDAVAADPDVLFVDEAAALPVATLDSLLAVGRIGFTTTVHGYEGAGRGFSVRFRAHLEEAPLRVTDVTMSEPVRYAAGDPVEVWSFRALLLDAAPAAEPVVETATPETASYRTLDAETLLDDEPLLREAFGLLVLAHYRTEPADLARLLDAPNVAARALCHDGHVVSVALLAREGALPAELRTAMYEGSRVRGNMLPDVLTSQLRDEAAGVPVGQRVMRIATHAAVRSEGLGSRLLTEIRDEFAEVVDWLGTGFGATPELLSFWQDNGFSTVHLSTSRNATSGEHSAIMLAPTSPEGRALQERHATRFGRRIGAVLSDALDTVDPDVVRATLRACGATVELTLEDDEWRQVAAAAYGPGLLDVDPGPFRQLATKHLVDPADPTVLTARQERLLIAKVLQARRWGAVADTLGYDSGRECMRALGDAYQPLVDAYGSNAARRERDRYLD